MPREQWLLCYVNGQALQGVWWAVEGRGGKERTRKTRDSGSGARLRVSHVKVPPRSHSLMEGACMPFVIGLFRKCTAERFVPQGSGYRVGTQHVVMIRLIYGHGQELGCDHNIVLFEDQGH